jgi:glycosyltransferase involved in cell wall biosynthesis
MGGFHGLVRLARITGPTKREIPPTGATILLTGTFHAESWARAHLEPLAASRQCTHLLVVCSFPLRSSEKLEVIHPPRLLVFLVGAVVARLSTFVWLAIRRRPHILGGFHLLFNGMMAALVGHLIGARSLYFCVGGPAEVLGGGVQAENRVFHYLAAPDVPLERRLLALVDEFDLIITMGTRAVQFFRERGRGHAFAVVPGGFNVDEFPLAASEQPTDIIFVGRLAPVKRVDLLLEAIARVRRTLPTVRAQIVGGGPLRQALEEQTSRMHLSSNVEFAGTQCRVQDWLTQARVFVLTSDSEGLALSVVEAMLCGLPIVCSHVGDLPDIVEDGINGYLVTPRTGAAFGDRILDLLTDPARARAFGQAGRHAAERLAIQHTASMWDQILSAPTFVDPALAQSRTTA